MDLRGLPEIRALLEQFGEREMVNRMRRGLRAGLKVFRTRLRAEARSRGDLPRTFAKTRTRSHRNPLGVSVSPASPLAPIFEHGAKTHPIAPRRGRLLANPKEGFVAAGAVSHPGMRARPLSAPVFEASKDEASRAIEAVVFEGIR